MLWKKLLDSNSVLLREILPTSNVKFIIGGSGIYFIIKLELKIIFKLIQNRHI